MHTWKRWLTFQNGLLITWMSPQDTWMRWGSCNLRESITWEMFLGFAQEMLPHLATWRSISTLGSQLKDLRRTSFLKQIANTPDFHSFGRIYFNLGYIRECCIKNSFYVKENYSKIKNNLPSDINLENQAFLIFFPSACAQMNIFTCSNDSTKLILYSAFITSSFRGFFNIWIEDKGASGVISKMKSQNLNTFST